MAHGVLKQLIAVPLMSLLATGCAASTDESPDPEVESDDAALVADPAAALTAATFEISRAAIQPSSAPFVSHGDYVAANVPYPAIGTLRAQVSKVLALSGQRPKEAHVTTITPPEMGRLTKRLSVAEIESIALHEGIRPSDLEPLCVGQGKVGSMYTFFLVTRSEQLLRVRRAVAKAFVAKGGAKADFDPESFYPHVTLGFTKRDLHFEDGVFKTVQSCPNPHGVTVRPLVAAAVARLRPRPLHERDHAE